MHTPIDPSTPFAAAQATPDHPTVLNRQVELDITLDQLWRLVSEADNLRDWLGDDLDLDMSPGSVGTFVDDGVTRHVRVDRVVEGRRLDFTWWRADDVAEVSHVVFRVEPTLSGGSRLDITETLRGTALGTAAGTGPERTAAIGWEIRMLSLWACTVVMALVQ